MEETFLTDPAAVYCPYYISETNTCIVCEGLLEAKDPATPREEETPDRACRDSVQRFATVEAKNRWMRQVCVSSRYECLCAVAGTLDRMYGEEIPEPEWIRRRFSRELKRARGRTRANRRKGRRVPAPGPRAAEDSRERNA